MSIDDSIVLELAPEESKAVFLFGSYARGDETPQSDVDVLAIVSPSFDAIEPPPSGLCIYTFRQLERMAQRGSLFILHLISEAKTIYDPQGLLHALSKRYKPTDWPGILGEVIFSAQLLTVNQRVYERRKFRYNRLVIHLIRTIAFAMVAKTGSPIFSMAKVALKLNLTWLATLPRPAEMTWPIYLDTLRKLKFLSGGDFYNPYITIEALIVHAWYKSPMCAGMGLRLLSDEPNLVYEDADLRWLTDD